MAFLVAVGVLIIALAVAAYFVLREQALPSKHEVATEFDPDACARAIFEALPQESRERLGYEGALQVVSYILDYMKLAGAVADGEDSEPTPEATIVLGGATSAGYLVDRATAAGVEMTAAEALTAVEASVAYLARIGATGPSITTEESR